MAHVLSQPVILKKGAIMSENIPHEKDKEPKKLADEQEPGKSDSSKERLSELYEKMGKELRGRMEKAGAVTEEALEKAIYETTDWAGKMKAHYQEDIDKVSGFLRRDWETAVKFTREETRKTLQPEKLQAGVLGLVSSLAFKAGGQIQRWASAIEKHITFEVGEEAPEGLLQCAACKETLKIEKSEKIPSCPKCGNTTYQRQI